MEFHEPLKGDSIVRTSIEINNLRPFVRDKLYIPEDLRNDVDKMIDFVIEENPDDGLVEIEKPEEDRISFQVSSTASIFIEVSYFGFSARVSDFKGNSLYDISLNDVEVDEFLNKVESVKRLI